MNIKIFDIEHDPDMREIQSYMGHVTGGTTVPRIFIDGNFIGGFDDLQRLHYTGELLTLLKSARVI